MARKGSGFRTIVKVAKAIDRANKKSIRETEKRKREHERQDARDLKEKHYGLSREAFLELPPGDERKQLMVLLLRKKSMVTYDWVIEEMGMRSKYSVYLAISRGRTLAANALKEWKRLKQVVFNRTDPVERGVSICRRNVWRYIRRWSHVRHVAARDGRG